jgi:hypothetical protein
MSEFKVLTYILPLKEAKKDFRPYEFEKMVTQHIQDGWKIINCEGIFLGGVSPTNGIHYWAYLVKD